MTNIQNKLTSEELEFLKSEGIDVTLLDFEKVLEDKIGKNNYLYKYKETDEPIQKSRTGSYCIIKIKNSDKYLVIDHYGQNYFGEKSNKHATKNFNLIGGGLEEGESFYEAMEREVEEELKMKISREKMEYLGLVNQILKVGVPSGEQFVGDFDAHIFYLEISGESIDLDNINKENKECVVLVGFDELKDNLAEGSNWVQKNLDKIRITKNLGWHDVKHIFKDSKFEAFAKLCEGNIKKDWDLDTLEIQTERLTLKPVSMDYAQDIPGIFTPETIQTLSAKIAEQLKNPSEYVAKIISKTKSKNNLFVCILNKENKLMGIVNVSDLNNENISFGIAINHTFWGNGYGYEALSALLDWVKVHINCKKIRYASQEENLRSINLAKKLGGVFVGKSKHLRSDNQLVDTVRYDIINPNYKPTDSRLKALVIKDATDKFSRSDLDKIQEIARSFGLPGMAYIQIENQTETGLEDSKSLNMKSPIFKFFGDETEQEQKKAEIVEHLNLEANDLVLFVGSENKELVYKVQNAVRMHIAKKLSLIDENELKFVWISDFPFFEASEEDAKTKSPAAIVQGENQNVETEKTTQKVDFGHNPFSFFKPFEGMTEIQTLETAAKENRLLEITARQFDIACNGYEVLSGGIRNNQPEVLSKAFEIVGYSKEEINSRFGHMMEAYSYGAPLHGGFAWGLDKMFMIMVGEDNIREVIAFPKNGAGMDTMTASPSEVNEKDLKALNISVVKKAKA
jgi:aspartyl-tRNA synthetase